MAIAKITNWLLDPDRTYEYGRSLYDQFGNNKLLSALFKGGSSPYHLNRLKTALEQLNPSLQEELHAPRARAIPELAEFTGPAITPVKGKPEYDSLPEAIKEVTVIKNQHYRRANQLFIEIGYTESEEKRLEMALIMLDDLDHVQQKWGAIDEYTKSGKTLEQIKKTVQEEISELSILELSKIVKNIPTYLSKDRAKVTAMAEGRQKAKVMQRISKNEIRLDLAKRRFESV